MSAVMVPSELSYNINMSFQGGILKKSFQPSEISSGILKKSYRIVLKKDKDGQVVVRSPDLQGVATDGSNENEAIQNAFEAVNAILEAHGLSKEYNLIVTHKLGA